MFTLLRVIVFLTTLCSWLGVGATPAIYDSQNQILTIPSVVVVNGDINQFDATQLYTLQQYNVVLKVKGFDLLTQPRELNCNFSPVSLGCQKWEK